MTRGFITVDQPALETLGFQYWYHLPDTYQMGNHEHNEALEEFMVCCYAIDKKIEIMRKWLK